MAEGAGAGEETDEDSHRQEHLALEKFEFSRSALSTLEKDVLAFAGQHDLPLSPKPALRIRS